MGSILAVGLFVWYIQTSGNQRNADQEMLNKDLVKIECVRCHGDPVKKKTCSLCNGYGYMWVDSSRKDLSPDVRPLVEEALRKREEAAAAK